MLTNVRILNFRALRDVELKLEPFTVLVGPNASGKSTILAALASPGSALDINDFWKRERSEISFHWKTDQANASGAASVRHPGGSWNGGVPWQLQTLRFDLDDIRGPVPGEKVTSLTPTGSSLTQLFDSLTRSQQTALSNDLCTLVPVFGEVDREPVTGGKVRLRFRDRWNDLWFTPEQVSDGTLLSLAILATRYQSPQPTILAIEDPERGLHPYLVVELIKVLRSLNEGPRPVQVILTTHSAELLDLVRPEEVRFVTRQTDDGAVRIDSVNTSEPDWERAFNEHRRSLGEAWLSGSLGGVPG